MVKRLFFLDLFVPGKSIPVDVVVFAFTPMDAIERVKDFFGDTSEILEPHYIEECDVCIDRDTEYLM